MVWNKARRSVGLFIQVGGVMALLVLGVGCASTSPVGAKNGKVASRHSGQGLYVVTQPGGKQVVVTKKTHTLQKGETLWRVAQLYKTSVDNLKKMNGITDVARLSVGMVLVVGEGSEVASVAEPGKAPAAKKKKKKRKHSTKKYPLRWPAEGAITARYGQRRGKPHDGIDIGASAGTAIHAAAAGVVVFSDKHGGYGNLIVLRHKTGLVTVYAHNRKNLVSKGQTVRLGELIAEVGDTGQSTGPHLHFEVRRGANPQNPLRFLPPN